MRKAMGEETSRGMKVEEQSDDRLWDVMKLFIASFISMDIQG